MRRYNAGWYRFITFWYGFSVSFNLDVTIRAYFIEFDASLCGAGIYIRLGKII